MRAPASGDSVKHYRVPSQGQSILDIAQTTLGNRSRWPEIYRLNLPMRPEYPIPGGTDLRLPADAVVP